MVIAIVIIVLCISHSALGAHKKMPLILDDHSQQKPMNRPGKQKLNSFELSISGISGILLQFSVCGDKIKLDFLKQAKCDKVPPTGKFL